MYMFHPTNPRSFIHFFLNLDLKKILYTINTVLFMYQKD